MLRQPVQDWVAVAESGVVSLPALAYYFGKLIPNLDQYVLLIVAVVLVVSVIPVVVKVMQARRGA